MHRNTSGSVSSQACFLKEARQLPVTGFTSALAQSRINPDLIEHFKWCVLLNILHWEDESMA